MTIKSISDSLILIIVKIAKMKEMLNLMYKIS
jgi:hypothetical protein